MDFDLAEQCATRDLYARAVPLFDRDDTAWVDQWAEDPEFFFPPDPATNFPGITLSSNEALTGMVRQAHGMIEGRGLHHFTNLVVDAGDEPDTARVRGCLLLVKTGSGPDNPSQVMQNTRIEDRVVRTGEGWKCKRRSVGSAWG